MTIQQSQQMSRRTFLKAAAVAGAGAALAACAAPGAAPGGSGAPAVNTGAKQTVRYLSWWFEEGNRGAT